MLISDKLSDKYVLYKYYDITSDLNNTITKADTWACSILKLWSSHIPLEQWQKMVLSQLSILLHIKSWQLQCLKTTVIYYYVSWFWRLVGFSLVVLTQLLSSSCSQLGPGAGITHRLSHSCFWHLGWEDSAIESGSDWGSISIAGSWPLSCISSMNA